MKRKNIKIFLLFLIVITTGSLLVSNFKWEIMGRSCSNNGAIACEDMIKNTQLICRDSKWTFNKYCYDNSIVGKDTSTWCIEGACSKISLDCPKGGCNTQPIICADSDSGSNINLKGTATFGVQVKTDYCQSSDKVVEYSCFNNPVGGWQILEVPYNCPASFECKEGACKPVSLAPVCGDGYCNKANENCDSCPNDCGACHPSTFCGDSKCNGDESQASCQIDCGSPSQPKGCSTDEQCMEEINSCFVSCIDNNCIKLTTSLYPTTPSCSAKYETIWQEYPICDWSECKAMACTNDLDCATNMTCSNGACIAKGIECLGNANCVVGKVCDKGFCITPELPWIWIIISLIIIIILIVAGAIIIR